MNDEWFRDWFGEEYLSLYAHRDREEAERAVELLRSIPEVGGGGAVLDLACGAGRHLEALERAGLRPVGFDLSPVLLRRARNSLPTARLVRADMRALPAMEGAFDVVVSFFTSFGYFRSSGEDLQVLREIRRVLRPEGILLLDHLNADRVRRELRPRDEERARGRTVVQERALVDGGRAVEKRIRITEDDRSPTEFRERVRLYGKEELEAAFRRAHLEPERSFGDYHGGPFEVESPRLILVGRAS